MRGRKWIIRGTAGTLMLLCAVQGAVGQTAKEWSKPAAIVNGETISVGMVQAMLRHDGPTPVAIPESERKRQMQVTLSALINEVLMRQFLKQNAPPVDAKAVEARMSDLVVGLQRQNKTLADFCRDSKQTPEQLKARVAAVLQWHAYANSRVSEQDVEKFYRENKDFFDKIQVHAAEIMLRVPTQADKSERERVKAQLAQLRAKILRKEISFGAAAKQYSQGPTKDEGEGGDLEWFPHLKDILPESVLQAAFTLQPGQISEVLDSDYGVHLIQVLERKPGEPSDFNKIKEDVHLMCIDEMKQNILKDLRQTAEKNGRIQVLLR